MKRMLKIIALFLLLNFALLMEVNAVAFTDHMGYLPNWAKPIGQNQALGVCNTSIDYDTKDFAWCMEFAGFVLDSISGKKNLFFKDHSGYIPQWASTMGQNQALGVCNTSIDYDTKDFAWCMEFAGQTLDELSGNVMIAEAVSESKDDTPIISSVPTWIRDTFVWYAEEKVTETELINSLKYLVENKIIIIDETQNSNTDIQTQLQNEIKSLKDKIQKLEKENIDLKSQISKLVSDNVNPNLENISPFSGVTCFKDNYKINIQGKYTNDENEYDSIYLTLAVLDANGNILDTGIATINDIEPFQTKIFSGMILYKGSYDSCDVEIDFKSK